MKGEIFTFMFDKYYDEWMEKHEIKFEDFFKKIKGVISQEFRDIVKDREEGMMNRYIRNMCANAETLGLD